MDSIYVHGRRAEVVEGEGPGQEHVARSLVVPDGDPEGAGRGSQTGQGRAGWDRTVPGAKPPPARLRYAYSMPDSASSAPRARGLARRDARLDAPIAASPTATRS
jgi:hypothetical protein